MSSIHQLVNEIGKLPRDWHKVGSVSPEVLRAIAKHLEDRSVFHSMETGSGKTTLLFSHLSQNHKVFAINDYKDIDTNSITAVRTSDLFNRATVEFIEGPTQLTLPRYNFEHKLQVAYIDGPHGYPFPDMEYYYIYPFLEENSLLIVDDIHIPTIHHLFNFLKEDEMFSFLEVVDNTAFFQRTSAPLFDPYLDGWWLQNYNKKHFPIERGGIPALKRKVKSWVPLPIKNKLKQVLARS
ncbi:MAG TPA: class I SAM-dependent methyltransferase [Candidatus Caenarcaniphilales bacterium]